MGKYVIDPTPMSSYIQSSIKEDVYVKPNYEIKTRSPRPENWRLNLMRGNKEDEFRGECFSISRRKCYDVVQEFAKCEKENGMIFTTFNCRPQADTMLKCFNFEFEVEMDKRRRDMKRNTEWWWRLYYDENGEVGDQANWKEEVWYILKLREFQDKFHSMFSSNS